MVVQAALGVAILPRRLGSLLDGVVQVRPAAIGAHDLGPLPSREIWMVVHRAKARVPKVRAVTAWLESVFAGAP